MRVEGGGWRGEGGRMGERRSMHKQGSGDRESEGGGGRGEDGREKKHAQTREWRQRE